MAELPRTEDLPRSTDGFEPARVEEAFSRFGERVRELESVASDLRAELRALRAERSAPDGHFGDEDWPGPDATAPPADWVAAIPPPFARGFAVPRLALEILFLLGVALLAGLADLETPWIVAVMAAAWLLVALSEWAAAATRARWHLEEIPPPLEAATAAGDESTGPWSVPVVEATVVEGPDVSESHTVVASLPAPLESTDEAAPPTEPQGGQPDGPRPDDVPAEEPDPAAAGEVVVPPQLPDAPPESAAAEPAGEAEAAAAAAAPDEAADEAGGEDAHDDEAVPALPEPVDDMAENGDGADAPEPAEDAEAAAEPRRRFWRRRRAEATAPDPWDG